MDEVKFVSKFIQSTAGPISLTWKLFIPTNNVYFVIIVLPVVVYVNKLKIVSENLIPIVNLLNFDEVTPIPLTFE